MPGQRLAKVEENVKFDDLAQVARWVCRQAAAVRGRDLTCIVNCMQGLQLSSDRTRIATKSSS